jgi:hypothetical protein
MGRINWAKLGHAVVVGIVAVLLAITAYFGI